MKVLVHECGHVVQPGDEIECVDGGTTFGYMKTGMYVFDRIEDHYMIHLKGLQYPRDARRFNCSIVEAPDA